MEKADSADEEEEQFFDDLEDYQEAMENQVFENVMNFKPMVEDDGKELNDINKEKPTEKAKKELTEEERYARDLKLKDAQKYFEVVKLVYLQSIISQLKPCARISHKYREIVETLLSLLDQSRLDRFAKLSDIQWASMEVENVLSFIKSSKQFIKQNHPNAELNWIDIFWSLCEQFNLCCRKVYFFDIEALVEELFYKLRYETNQKKRKRQNKKTKQQQLMKIKIEQRIEQQLLKESSGNFLNFDDFQFDANSFQNSRNSSASQSESQTIKENFKMRRQNNWIRKKNYKQAYFQVFSIVDKDWKFINAQILEIEQENDFKRIVLEGKPIIGFIGFRLLHFKPIFEPLVEYRTMRNIAVDDLTMYFYDSFKLVNERRRRLGCKIIMRRIFKKGGFWKDTYMLEERDQFLIRRMQQIQLQFYLSVFPTTKKELFNSQYFVTPSSLPQYCILDPEAKPIDRIFFEEQVYRKRNMIQVTSRNGWIDKGRKIKRGELPVKKTENKSKNMTELFVQQQTEPFSMNIDPQTGNFLADDEYNNIYVPPGFKPSEQFTIINKKISFVCNKAKIRHIQLVQGFTRAIGRILPNYIGFLVYKEDEKQILEMFEERQAKLLENKSKNREKDLVSFWNKLFKKIELNEWSHNFMKK